MPDKIIYCIMLSSFAYFGFQGPTLKDKALGFLLTLVNAIIFSGVWK